jgi:protein disulfide-isomerase-like protein
MLKNMSKWPTAQKVLFALLLLIIVVAIFTPKNVNNALSAGFGVHGHLGNLKGNFNIETMEQRQNSGDSSHGGQGMMDHHHGHHLGHHHLGHHHHGMMEEEGLMENMTGSMDSSSPEAVLFYAPWCGHCKKMMPEWDSLGSSVGNVSVKKVDCDQNSEAASAHGVQGFPTIMYFENGMSGGNGEGYDGERSATALRNWISAKGTLAMGPNDGNSAQVGYQGMI